MKAWLGSWKNKTQIYVPAVKEKKKIWVSKNWYESFSVCVFIGWLPIISIWHYRFDKCGTVLAAPPPVWLTFTLTLSVPLVTASQRDHTVIQSLIYLFTSLHLCYTRLQWLRQRQIMCPILIKHNKCKAVGSRHDCVSISKHTCYFGSCMCSSSKLVVLKELCQSQWCMAATAQQIKKQPFQEIIFWNVLICFLA